jgi:hypothetical protein
MHFSETFLPGAYESVRFVKPFFLSEIPSNCVARMAEPRLFRSQENCFKNWKNPKFLLQTNEDIRLHRIPHIERRKRSLYFEKTKGEDLTKM